MPNKTLVFNQNEWLQIASLLKKGYPMQEILKLLHRYEHFMHLFDSQQAYEDSLLACAKGRFQKHLLFFIQIQSLQDAIYSADEMCQFEKGIISEFYKKTMYPFIVFLLSFATIHTFSNYVLPQLLQQFSQNQDNTIVILLYVVKVISTLLLALLILFSFVVFAMIKVKTCNHYFFEHYAYRIPFVKEYISYYLSGYLSQLHRRGLSSKQSFQFLLQMKPTYLQKCVVLINAQLAKGSDLLEVLNACQYLSQRFLSYFLIGSHNGELESALEAYMSFQKAVWLSLIKKLSIIVQCVSYAFVGILVICVYQIMLLPLQMINEI